MQIRKPNARPLRRTTRRSFCSGAAGCAAVLFVRRDLAGVPPPAAPAGTPTRPDVAAIDHDRILAAAKHWLAQRAVPVTSLPCPRSPGTAHDYYSEAEQDTEAVIDSPDKRAALAPFTAHRDALFGLGLAVPALAAAYLLTGDPRYAAHAAEWLRAWFIDPATRMTPRLDYASTVYPPAPQTVPNGDLAAIVYPGGRAEGILETLPLVEVAQAVPFLASSGVLSEADRNAVKAWFAAYLQWLTVPEESGPRLAALARDRKDHHATSWLLQASAYTLLGAPQGDVERAEDSRLAALRHRFKTVTLRAQMRGDGTFPQELASPNPYRDSLFNLDMMAGVCHLLSTRLDALWNYSLQDGPGMRSAIAFHFPFIADRSAWPYRADAEHFKELPARRASLLLAARAYERPEYAALWKTLPADPPSAAILRTLPIHQPVLWVRQPAPAL
ncbi:MAG TPA: alginate lyase family protein [Acidobacteriaceae bacterium]|nr:alginate lyase family protein [Acidobacteriaceae bacterium]